MESTSASNTHPLVPSQSNLKLLENLVKFIKRNDGRDKSFRVVQYTTLVLLWAYKHKSVITSTKLSQMVGYDLIAKVARAMSTSRKCLKFFRMLEDIQAIVKAWIGLVGKQGNGGNGLYEALRLWVKSGQVPISIIVLVLKMVSASLEIIYYYYDHLVWFYRNSILVDDGKGKAARASYMSSVFWLGNAFLDAVVETIEYNEWCKSQKAMEMQKKNDIEIKIMSPAENSKEHVNGCSGHNCHEYHCNPAYSHQPAHGQTKHGHFAHAGHHAGSEHHMSSNGSLDNLNENKDSNQNHAHKRRSRSSHNLQQVQQDQEKEKETVAIVQPKPVYDPIRQSKKLSLLKIWLDVVTAWAETESVTLPFNGVAFIEATSGWGASVLGLMSVWKATCSS